MDSVMEGLSSSTGPTNCLLVTPQRGCSLIFFCGVRIEEEERGPLERPRLHPDGASSGPGRNVGHGAERQRQSADCCAGEPVGQPRTRLCEGEHEGDVSPGHHQGNAHVSYDRGRPEPSHAHFSLDQVQSNEPGAIYTLKQKERELRFPFQITEDGDIQLTEELDREDKNMVSGGLEPSAALFHQKSAFFYPEIRVFMILDPAMLELNVN